jgi:hypothetical protein
MTIDKVCIKKAHSGIHVFDELYNSCKTQFICKFDFEIMEISTGNNRFLRAHERVEFKTVHTFKVEFEEWSIVWWDKKNVLE